MPAPRENALKLASMYSTQGILEYPKEIKHIEKDETTTVVTQILPLPSGVRATRTIIQNPTGKKANLAGDIVMLVDEADCTIKDAADATGMSQQYAGHLYHKAKIKQGRHTKD